jgi:hypothetical protein
MKVMHARDDNRIENSRRKPGKIWVIGARSDSYRRSRARFDPEVLQACSSRSSEEASSPAAEPGIACNGSGRVSLRPKARRSMSNEPMTDRFMP